MNINENDITCPITKQIFSNPVIADDGNVYEKDAIIKWLELKNTSPINRSNISYNLKPVKLLTTIINNLIENNPELKPKQYISVEEFTKNKSKIYSLIKNNKFDDLLNYSYFDLIQLEYDTLNCIIFNKKKSVSYLHYIFRFCKNDDVLSHIIDDMDFDAIKLLRLLCSFSSELLILKYIDKFPIKFNFKTLFKWTPLHFFVKRGLINAINKIFEHQQIDTNVMMKTKTIHRYTPLMLAIKNKNHEVIKLLIKNKKELNYKLNNKSISYAIKSGLPLKMIKYMINNSKLHKNILFDLLNNKMYYRLDKVIIYLIRSNIGLKYTDANGYNVLHTASTHSNKIIIMICRKKKSSINKTNHNDSLNEKYDFNITNNNNNNNGNNNVNEKYDFIKPNNNNSVNENYDFRQDSENEPDYNIFAPWMLILTNNKFLAFKYIIKYIDPTITSDINSGLIHFLAENANYETFMLAMDQFKLDFNVKNYLDFYPIHYALKSNRCPKVLKIIINESIYFDTADTFECYPIHYALLEKYNFPDIIKLLFTKITNFETEFKDAYPIHLAVKYNTPEICKLLIDKGVNLEVINEDKQTPIHILCKDNIDGDLIKYMIDEKNVNIDLIDEYGCKPLHYICMYGPIDLAKYMINKTKNHSTNITIMNDKNKVICTNLIELLMQNELFPIELCKIFNIKNNSENNLENNLENNEVK